MAMVISNISFRGLRGIRLRNASSSMSMAFVPMVIDVNLSILIGKFAFNVLGNFIHI
jgi:hypothetical protein